ncbi:MAG: hypothetical protein AAGA66_05190 [Bacteroidota bacterium]
MPSFQKSILRAFDIPEYCSVTKFKKMIQSKILTVIILVSLLGFSTQTFSYPNKNKMENTTRELIGLLVTMKAKPGKEQAVIDFLLGGLPLVKDEPDTQSWYAFQIGDNTFGIFDTFSKDEGRQAHLEGEVAKALLANADDLLVDFEVSVSIQPVDLLATKLSKGDENKGLLVIMKAKEGKTSEVENFLLSGKKLVNDEPKTLSWYAIQINSDTYAIFDTFSEESGRDAHLNGKVAAALVENAPVILEGFDTQAIQMIDILTSK